MARRSPIASCRPGDLALALLARGGTERIKEIAHRAAKMKGAKRQRVLTQLVLLSGLRRVTERIRMELKTMLSATDPFLKNEFVQDAMRIAISKMLRRQLATKFGELPKWAVERLADASTVQIERWSTKILSADSLEGVFGKQASAHRAG